MTRYRKKAVSAACLAFVALGGCSAASSNEKVEEKTCATGYCAELTYDAGGGAMTSAYSSVYILGKNGADRRRIFTGDNMDGLKIHWSNERMLEIRYSGGSVTSFTSTWSASQPSGIVGGDVEAVLLKTKGSEPPVPDLAQ